MSLLSLILGALINPSWLEEVLASQARIDMHLDGIDTKLLNITQRIERMGQTLEAGLAVLATEVSENGTVIGSATAVINGFAARLEAAIAAALAQGATPEQLTTLTALSTELDTRTAELAAAVAANTPAEGEPVPDPV